MRRTISQKTLSLIKWLKRDHCEMSENTLNNPCCGIYEETVDEKWDVFGFLIKPSLTDVPLKRSSLDGETKKQNCSFESDNLEVSSCDLLSKDLDLSLNESVEKCSCHFKRHRLECKRSNEDSWEKIFAHWKSNALKPDKLTHCLKQGLPFHLRGKLWKHLLQIDELERESHFNYDANVAAIRDQLVDLGVTEYSSLNSVQELHEMNDNEGTSVKNVDHLDIKVLRQIMLDVDRTFPTHIMFASAMDVGKEGKAALFRILALYARYNPAVGYCQGMSYIAAMFLMHLDERESFWCCVALFERQKYLLGYFSESLYRIQDHVQVFDKLLQQRLPMVWEHMKAVEASALMYLTPWFMCLYTSLPCWRTVLHIWDLLLLEGVSALFKVALAIVTVCHENLLQCTSISTVLPILLKIPAKLVEYDTFIHVIAHTKVEKWEINSVLAMVKEKEDKTSKLPSSPDVCSKLTSKFMKESENKENCVIHKVPVTKSKHKWLGIRSSLLGKSSTNQVVHYNKPSGSSQVHLSPCEIASESSFDELERSAQVGHLVLTSTPRESYLTAGVQQDSPQGFIPNFVAKTAKSEHAFRQFANMAPLRESQQLRSTASPRFSLGDGGGHDDSNISMIEVSMIDMSTVTS